MFVFFVDEPKFGVKNIKEYCNQMQEQHVNRAILIFQQNITHSAKQAISDFSSQFTLEYFYEAELMINVTDHILNPKFFVMKPEEKKALAEK